MLVKTLKVPLLWLLCLVLATASTLKDHEGKEVKVVHVEDLPDLLGPQSKAVRRAIPIQPVTAVVNLINYFNLFEFCARYINQPVYPNTATVVVQTSTIVTSSTTTEIKPTVTVTTYLYTAPSPLAKRTSRPEFKHNRRIIQLPSPLRGQLPTIVSSACSLALATRTTTLQFTTTTTTTTVTTTTTSPTATVTGCAAAQQPVSGGGVGQDGGTLNFFTDPNADACCTRCFTGIGCGNWFFFPGFGCFNTNGARGPNPSTQCPAGFGRTVLISGSPGTDNVGGPGPCSGGFS